MKIHEDLDHFNSCSTHFQFIFNAFHISESCKKCLRLEVVASGFLDAMMFAGGRSVPLAIDLVMGYILTKNKPATWRP